MESFIGLSWPLKIIHSSYQNEKRVEKRKHSGLLTWDTKVIHFLLSTDVYAFGCVFLLETLLQYFQSLLLFSIKSIASLCHVWIFPLIFISVNRNTKLSQQLQVDIIFSHMKSVLKFSHLDNSHGLLVLWSWNSWTPLRVYIPLWVL